MLDNNCNTMVVNITTLLCLVYEYMIYIYICTLYVFIPGANLYILQIRFILISVYDPIKNVLKLPWKMSKNGTSHADKKIIKSSARADCS